MYIYEALQRWTIWLCGYVVLVVCINVLLDYTPLGRDDSDPGMWGERSGLRPLTDHLTGCQYLAVKGAGIAPRVDRDGKHVGCR